MATDEVSYAKIAAGAFGAFVSLKWVQGTPFERFSMGVGGSALSYYATTPTVAALHVADAEGLVGFLLGVFGMALIAKGYEILSLIDAKQAAKDLWEAAVRKWKA